MCRLLLGCALDARAGGAHGGGNGENHMTKLDETCPDCGEPLVKVDHLWPAGMKQRLQAALDGDRHEQTCMDAFRYLAEDLKAPGIVVQCAGCGTLIHDMGT